MKQLFFNHSKKMPNFAGINKRSKGYVLGSGGHEWGRFNKCKCGTTWNDHQIKDHKICPLVDSSKLPKRILIGCSDAKQNILNKSKKRTRSRKG